MMDLPAIQEHDPTKATAGTVLTNGLSKEAKDTAPPPEHLVTSREREYLARVCWLLHDAGTLALRATFDSIHPPLTLPDHLQYVHVKSMLQKLHQQNILSDKQWRQLYPPKKRKKRGQKLVSSKDFDTKVLVVLLQTVCHLTPPYPHGWHAMPLPADSSLSADVVRLQLKLQEVGALSGLRKEEYPVVWTQVTDVLNRLGNNEVRVKIQRIENEILPLELAGQYIQLIKTAWAPGEAVEMMNKLKELEEMKRRGGRGSRSAYRKKDGDDDGIPPEDRVVITKCFKLLQDSVMVEDVLDKLQQGQIVKVNDRHEIMAPAKNADRMQVLLPKVMKSPVSYAFKVLCEAIKFKYPRVYETVMKTRKAVYKQGVSETLDFVGLSVEGLQTHYKEVLSKMMPLSWAERQASVKEYFSSPEIVDALGNKVPICELLPAQTTTSRGPRVILEGFAGSGNTTLAAMIAYLWATQPNYFSKKYTFLLYLDAQAIKGSLQEEIYNQLLPPNFRVTEQEFWTLMENSGREVAVVLDGWEGGQGGPDLAPVVNGSVLRSCAALLFVRPEAKVDYYVRPDYKLYNLGLTGHGSIRCLKTFTTFLEERDSDEESNDMTARSDPDDEIEVPLPDPGALRPYMSSPFVCTCVLAVYRELTQERLNQVTTLTGLMEQYLIALALVYCRTKDLEMAEGEFPEEVTKTIGHLETLAFHSLTTKSLAFSEEELQSITPNVDLTETGALTQAGPGLKWKFTCSLLRDFLSARYLADLPTKALIEKLENFNFLRSPRTAQVVAFACGLYRKDYSTQTLHVLFQELSSQNARRSKKISFKPPEIDNNGPRQTNVLNSGSVISYAPSFLALTEIEGREDAIQILSKSFPKLLQLCGGNMVHRRLITGLNYMVRDERVVLTNMELNLVHLHCKQKDIFLSFAEALALNRHLKTLTVAWTSIELMAEFLKICLSNHPALSTLRVIDQTRKPPKLVDASTLANIQDFCNSLSNVNLFSLFNCKLSSVTGHVIKSLPPTLKILDLARSSLNMICMDELGKLMERSTGTHTIRLTDTCLEGTDLAALFQGLKRCDTLASLGLAGVRLDRIGFGHFIEYLRLTSSIRDLDLSRTRMTMEMCQALAGVLEESRGIKRVDVQDSLLPKEGRDLLEAAAGDTVYVEGLDCDSSSIVTI